jgi:hypothetical protein
MITLRKNLAVTARTGTLLPALAFLGCATLTAAGGDAVVALCLVPAGLALEATLHHAGGAGKNG